MNIDTFTLSSETKDGTKLLSYVAIPENINDQPIPGILVAPEWWGVVEHPKSVTKRLAKLGFAVVTMDIYGDGKLTTDASQANEWMTQMLDDQDALMERCKIILEDFSNQAKVDASKIGIVGYCFGGKIALDMAREGMPIKAVATFHGNPTPKQPATKDKFKAKVLFAHGEADAFIPIDSVNALKEELDSAEVDYTIDIYEGAKHGFTNPMADQRAQENGVDLAYNEEAADTSWEVMVNFMQEVLK